MGEEFDKGAISARQDERERERERMHMGTQRLSGWAISQ
jgi:hypothetical protein